MRLRAKKLKNSEIFNYKTLTVDLENFKIYKYESLKLNQESSDGKNDQKDDDDSELEDDNPTLNLNLKINQKRDPKIKTVNSQPKTHNNKLSLIDFKKITFTALIKIFNVKKVHTWACYSTKNLNKIYKSYKNYKPNYKFISVILASIEAARREIYPEDQKQLKNSKNDTQSQPTIITCKPLILEIYKCMQSIFYDHTDFFSEGQQTTVDDHSESDSDSEDEDCNKSSLNIRDPRANPKKRKMSLETESDLPTRKLLEKSTSSPDENETNDSRSETFEAQKPPEMKKLITDVFNPNYGRHVESISTSNLGYTRADYQDESSKQLNFDMTSTDLKLFGKNMLEIQKFAVEILEDRFLRNQNEKIELEQQVDTLTCQSILKTFYNEKQLRKDVINDALRYLNEFFITVDWKFCCDKNKADTTKSIAVACLLLAIDKNYNNCHGQCYDQIILNFNDITVQNFLTNLLDVDFEILQLAKNHLDIFFAFVKKFKNAKNRKIIFESEIVKNICFFSESCKIA